MKGKRIVCLSLSLFAFNLVLKSQYMVISTNLILVGVDDSTRLNSEKIEIHFAEDRIFHHHPRSMEKEGCSLLDFVDDRIEAPFLPTSDSANRLFTPPDSKGPAAGVPLFMAWMQEAGPGWVNPIAMPDFHGIQEETIKTAWPPRE